MAATGPNHGKVSPRDQGPGATPSQNNGATASQNMGGTPQATEFAVDRILSDEPHPNKQLTFIRFGRLPAEIRNMVWHEALAPRVIMIYPRVGSTQTKSPDQVDWKKIPGILFACKESRDIAKPYYQQKFTLVFTRALSTIVMCQIPIIMSKDDELAISATYLSTRFGDHDVTQVTVKAAEGAPEPRIDRLSLLGNSLLREGIDQEQLAHLLKTFSGAWGLTDHISPPSTWTTRWSPFGKQPDPKTLGRYLGDVEDVCIQSQTAGDVRNDADWLWMAFNFWCFDSTLANEWDYVDAWISENPVPYLGEEEEKKEEDGE
ncbi:hypothetical protein KVR01_011884 [Diaporthe batatas]|uniref:uncharacterized protein n=1 Tax=Diaporthe batatas TaxID=748121 RepID=UPI001D04F4E8|nr:uncharacterized protein KVR01_011884 [Diaporthe batatas]KAG8158123.1 hypothetical protein KVR01_011884 [Diaporthe batatas]